MDVFTAYPGGPTHFRALSPGCRSEVLTPRPSTTRHIHKPKNLDITLSREVVTLRFQVHGVDDGFPQFVVSHRVTTQNTAQVYGVLIAKTEQQTALYRYPYAVAGRAEVVGVR